MGGKKKSGGSGGGGSGSSSSDAGSSAGSGKGVGGGKRAAKEGGGFPNALITPADLKQAIAAAAEGLVVLDFTAPWCGVCKKINPFLSKLAAEQSGVAFYKVDVDQSEQLKTQWNVPALPHFVFLKGGKKIDCLTGAQNTVLRKKVIKHSK
eukprot:gene18358-4666_t